MAKRSNGKGRTKREGHDLLARRCEAFARWRKGETQTAIAKSFKVSVATISLDCQLAAQEFRAGNRASVSEAVELEWGLLNRLQFELEQLYEESREQKKPDWRILSEGVLKVIVERRKLLGTDKPVKIEAQTTTEVNYSTSFKPLEEMKAELRRHEAAMKARKADSAK